MAPGLFILCFFLLVSIPAKAQEIVGSWKGNLMLNDMEMPLVFHISQEEGVFSSTMDRPSEGATGIPMDETFFSSNELTIVSKESGIRYVGLLKGDMLKGTFYQAGAEMPLTLIRSGQTLPGNPELVTSDEVLGQLASLDQGNYRYTVEDYFARPQASTFRFSPDGKYLSYRERDENARRHLVVKEVATGKVQRAVEEGEELIRGYGWLNNERLVYVMDEGGNENYHVYAVNLDGSKLKDLTPFEGVRALLTDILKDDKDHIIIQLNKNNPQVFEPYKVHVESGEMVQLYSNTDLENPISSYTFDREGQLKAFTRIRDGVYQDIYYSAGEEFSLIKQLDWYETFSILRFNDATSNPHDAYVLTNLESDKAEIVLYDLKENKVLEVVFSNDLYDVSGMDVSRKRNWEVDYFSYEGKKRVIIPVSDLYKVLHANFQSLFPDKSYSVVDNTDAEDQFLLYVYSDRSYGKYFSYDADKGEFKELYELMPQLKEADMAQMMPISFKSRDGLTLHGYLTLPEAALAGEKVPVIVNPHGGPQGIRDSWGFNPEAQLFASRGYATLQVNFRISGGYGKEFLKAGFKQIGRKAMDDVEDGVQYIIDQGWVNKDKVAIYGGSHGGYAVLRGLTKTPGLYACGVDYVGVSNLFTFMETIPPYWKPYLKILHEIWYNPEIPEEKAIMEEVSPVFHIDKIEKPLFVVQGANDPRVNIDESDQIVSALRSKGFEVPYMVKYDEGHGFGKEENSIHLYKAMMGFFAKHLGQKELHKPLTD